jgi:hypothetical protein
MATHRGPLSQSRTSPAVRFLEPQGRVARFSEADSPAAVAVALGHKKAAVDPQMHPVPMSPSQVFRILKSVSDVRSCSSAQLSPAQPRSRAASVASFRSEEEEEPLAFWEICSPVRGAAAAPLDGCASAADPAERSESTESASPPPEVTVAADLFLSQSDSDFSPREAAPLRRLALSDDGESDWSPARRAATRPPEEADADEFSQWTGGCEARLTPRRSGMADGVANGTPRRASHADSDGASAAADPGFSRSQGGSGRHKQEKPRGDRPRSGRGSEAECASDVDGSLFDSSTPEARRHGSAKAFEFDDEDREWVRRQIFEPEEPLPRELLMPSSMRGIVEAGRDGGRSGIPAMPLNS